MHILTAYERRETLAVSDIERLLEGLIREVEDYRLVIRNYPPDRMRDYGTPYLEKLETRVSVVKALLDDRRRDIDAT